MLEKAAEENIKLHIVDKERLDSMTGNARHQGVA
ncbi:RNA methyltransferase substrate-binding domain-containing protein [Paludibacterium denitrificans]|nr:RNA methyltransferase substrate-binding domain-containing protein [Paludibacterium denitrificans]